MTSSPLPPPSLPPLSLLPPSSSLQEGQLSYEEAIIARQNHVRETQERVQQLKEEYDLLMRQYFAQREEEQQEMRRLVEATMAGHQSTKEAKKKLQTMKQKIGTGSF